MLLRHVAIALGLVVAGTPASADARYEHPQRHSTYCVSDLGEPPDFPPGDPFPSLADINNRGQIVGTASRGGMIRAFVWQQVEGMRTLGVLPGTVYSSATGIDDRGRVVGVSFDAETPFYLAFIWDSRNGLRMLDVSLGGERHSANAINRLGQITGESETATGQLHVYFRDVNGKLHDLGPGYAAALNDRGHVVGGDEEQIFIWDKRRGRRTLFDAPSNRVILPYDMNNRVEVVGEVLGEGTRAFRWTARGGLQDLGSLAGDDPIFTYTSARAINEWGTIVGASQVPGGAAHAFIWRDHSGMQDLNGMLDATSPLASTTVLVVAEAINEFGWIAATGFDTRDESVSRAYLLRPPRRGQPCE